jgi:hypothetical protein
LNDMQQAFLLQSMKPLLGQFDYGMFKMNMAEALACSQMVQCLQISLQHQFRFK